MTDDRAFSDEDVERIFARASELDLHVRERHRLASQTAPPVDDAARGLSLAELQAIGREAGISEEAVAHAAHEVSMGAASPGHVSRWMGLPYAVRHELRLETPVSDLEWTHIVVRLRETFDARGTLREQGAFREWSNGNLQASLEPTDTGHVLRLRTRNGEAGAMLGVVGGLGSFAAMLGVLGTFLDRPKAFVVAALIGSIAVGIAGWQLIALPRWGSTRARQFRELLQSVLSDRITHQRSLSRPAAPMLPEPAPDHRPDAS
jgi:hypothetical protein